jgi:Domain of unknown function (DUF3846)
MKAILIDSVNREVKEIEIGKGIDEMYKFLQCECFTVASYLDKEDAIFVDDEGLMNGTDNFFTFEGAHQPFAGNGLIMGCDDEGESEDCKISFDEVKEKVKFYDRYELSLGIAMGLIKSF